MRVLTPNSKAEWNPVPFRFGFNNLESQKPDNFGQIVAPPYAVPGYLTIPGIYEIPEEIEDFDLAGEDTNIYIKPYDAIEVDGRIIDITSSCSEFTVGGKKYLKIPAVPMTQNQQFRPECLVQLIITNITGDLAGEMNPWDYISEPYRVSPNIYGQFAIDYRAENQNPVVLRWWDANDFIMEEFSDTKIILPYASADHHFELAFPCQLSKPEYSRDEEGTERDGLFFPDKRVLKKSFRFSFLAPEYVLDAIRFAEIADFVEVSQGDKVYAVDNLQFEISWVNSGSTAKVVCTFTTASIIRKFSNYSE